MNATIFVYAKDGIIICRNLDDSLDQNLKAKGWTHAHTIDPCLFIEHLHNKCSDLDILKEIKKLST